MHCGLRLVHVGRQDRESPDIPVNSIFVNPNNAQQVYAGTDWGVYYTDDVTVASPIWQRFENGIPHAMIWDMQIDRGSTALSVWTRSRGAYVYPLPEGRRHADTYKPLRRPQLVRQQHQPCDPLHCEARSYTAAASDAGASSVGAATSDS